MKKILLIALMITVGWLIINQLGVKILKEKPDVDQKDFNDPNSVERYIEEG